ncbi:hypothetical protein FRB96_003206 [Tulasnella sp. 330]|nr:hypothetical protein FRB96_003206 [Tulasnella sp. 330]KAG8868551.1 hypothetical protein FRB97_002202 [Tulasnella sp. 331]KAG8869805.1 hypothetical protein FRB98_002172 [Tulasnella sp. 332]
MPGYQKSPPASPGTATFGSQAYLDPSRCLARPSHSPYRRTFDATQRAHEIDLDRFDIDIPAMPISLTPSRSPSYSEGRRMGYRRTRTASCQKGDVTLPDLGEVDLGDGKNADRPQRFKAIIHCKKKERQENCEDDQDINQSAQSSSPNSDAS